MNNWKLVGKKWYLIWHQIPENIAVRKMYEIAEEKTEKLQLWEYLNNQWQLRYTLNKTNSNT